MKNKLNQTEEQNKLNDNNSSLDENIGTENKIATDSDKDTEIRVKSLEEKVEELSKSILSISELIKELNKAKQSEITDEIDETYKSDKDEYLSVKQSILKELSPYVDMIADYNQKCERDNVLKAMMLTEEMSDAFDVADELDRVVECYPALKNSSDAMEKYVTAYVIFKGKSAIDNSKMTPDTLITLLENNPELKKAVILKIKDEFNTSSIHPKLDFEGGITTLNIPEKPKNMHDAKKASFKLFK